MRLTAGLVLPFLPPDHLQQCQPRLSALLCKFNGVESWDDIGDPHLMLLSVVC